jgi:ligand-binding sensor domain-containing protein
VIPFISEKSLSPKEKYSIQTWTTENGLPQNSINDIAQTKDGYLWLATFDGLVRFDGVKFSTFNTSNTPVLKSNGIKQLFIDYEDRLWIITVDGLLTGYARNTFTSYTLPARLNIYANVITDYTNGSVLVLCADNKLYQLKNNQFVQFPLKEQGKMNAIRSLNTNQLYIACDQGLVSYINNEYYSFPETQGTRISNLYYSPFSEIIAAAEDKLYEVHAGSCKVLNLKHTPGSSGYNLIGYNEEKQLCFLTENGLLLPDGSLISTQSGLSSNSTRAIFVDRENNLWIGTNNGGLNKLKHKLFKAFSKDEGMLSDVSTSIIAGSNGSIYIGHNCGGISEFSNGRFLQDLPQPKEKCVWTIMEDREANLWASVYGNGICKIKNNKITYYNTTDGLSGNLVFSLYRDPRDRIWMGTSNGLCYYSPGTFTRVDTSFHQGICFVYEDRTSQLWLGTGAGLATLTNNKITLKDTAAGYKRSSVRYIYEDAEGVLWIGYHGEGLARIKNGRIFYFNDHSPLLNKNVWSITEDKNGNLWLPSNSGMYVIDKKELSNFADNISQELNPVLLTKEDGLKSMEFNGGSQPSVLKNANGEFWFPTVKGVAVIDPSSLFKQNISTRIIIEGIRIGEREQVIRDSVLSEPGNTSVLVSFACPTFNNASRMFFEYKLEGLSSKWISNGTSREIRLAGLPAGSYLLKIRAAGNTAISEASIRIIQETEFWKKPRFIITAGVIVLFTILFATILIIGRIRKREKLKTQINRQYANIELKALQAQMNPHFIFNCLNSIQHFIILNDEVSASKYLTKFSMLMRRSLEHSKSNMVSLQDEIELLRLYVELEAMRSKDKFNFQLRIEPGVDIFNIEIPSMLFQPFLENAITHGLLNLDRKGTLSVSFAIKDSHLIGIIEDDGIGRKQAKIINAEYYKGHTSRGMEIIKERIRVLNYIENISIELTIEDKTGTDGQPQGTRATITIPI